MALKVGKDDVVEGGKNGLRSIGGGGKHEYPLREGRKNGCIWEGGPLAGELHNRVEGRGVQHATRRREGGIQLW